MTYDQLSGMVIALACFLAGALSVMVGMLFVNEDGPGRRPPPAPEVPDFPPADWSHDEVPTL